MTTEQLSATLTVKRRALLAAGNRRGYFKKKFGKNMLENSQIHAGKSRPSAAIFKPHHTQKVLTRDTW